MEETLGKRIAFHRKRLGLTQDALAEQLGVTAQAVSKWENDQSCPDITMLPKLAEVFDVTTDELLGIPRKDVHLAQIIPEDAQQDTPEPDDGPASGGRQSFRSDAAKRRSLCMALWLLLSGLVAFFNSLHQVHLSIWDCMIASGIFVFGLSGLLRRFSVFRLVCIAAGCYFMVHIITDTSLGGIDWRNVFAIGLALLGLSLLVDTILGRKKELPMGHELDGAAKNYCTYDGTRFTCATCFGEGERLIQLPLLTGGSGEVTFGQLYIDLSGCGKIADGCTIDLRCSFGSLEIRIPGNYRVKAASSSAFGTVEEKGAADPAAGATIYLNCKAQFGEITVRHI